MTARSCGGCASYCLPFFWPPAATRTRSGCDMSTYTRDNGEFLHALRMISFCRGVSVSSRSARLGKAGLEAIDDIGAMVQFLDRVVPWLTALQREERQQSQLNTTGHHTIKIYQRTHPTITKSTHNSILIQPSIMQILESLFSIGQSPTNPNKPITRNRGESSTLKKGK